MKIIYTSLLQLFVWFSQRAVNITQNRPILLSPADAMSFIPGASHNKSQNLNCQKTKLLVIKNLSLRASLIC